MPYYNRRPRQSIPFSGPTRASVLKSATPGWVNLSTPFSAEFVSQFKALVQPSSRRWDPVTKMWSLQEAYLEEVVGLMQLHFDEVVTDLGQAPAASGNPFAEVLKLIPKADLDKVYRSLAFAVHPDRGGTEQSMKLLNEAFNEAKK